MQLHGSIWLVSNYWMLPKALWSTNIDLSFENILKRFFTLKYLRE